MRREVKQLAGAVEAVAHLSGGEPPMILVHLEQWQVVCTLLAAMVEQTAALYSGKQDMPAGFDGASEDLQNGPQSPATGNIS